MDRRSGSGGASAPVQLPSLPADPSISIPALPSDPSITLPALPPYPRSLPKPHHNGSANPSSSTSAASLPGDGDSSGYGGAGSRSISSHGTSSSSASSSSSSSSHLTLISVLGVLVTVTALTLVSLLVFLIRRQRKQLLKSVEAPHDSIAGHKDALQSPKNPLRKWLRDTSTFRRFSYAEIERSTDNFSTIIGKGGFGTVYKAQFGDGLVAAVKRMYRVSRQREKEFCKEMEFLGRLHHRHLVTLRGFCITKTERFLVYEYMENGSLKEHLQSGHSKTPIDWRTRIQVAIDVAAALEYLHFFCDPPLCHRDIKSSNILLDRHFVAKVADFGLAHAAPSTSPSASNEPQMSTDVRGTPGYLDPEYVITRQLNVKSDIYSYGVLLLELITGRGAVQDNRNLVAWAAPYLAAEAKLGLLVDPELEDRYDEGELRSLVRLLRMCTHKESRMRPSIRQVLGFLYEKLDRDGAHAMPHALAAGNTQSGAGPAATAGTGATTGPGTGPGPGPETSETSGFSSTFSSSNTTTLSTATTTTKAYRFDTASVTSASASERPLLD